jgi:HlyD family secretion protein
MKISDTSSQDVMLKPQNRHRLWFKLTASLVLILIVGWLTAPMVQRWAQAEESVSGNRVRTAAVERGDFVRDVTVQGRVVAAVSPTLYASQNGTITFSVDAGDSVNEGDELANIDSPEMRNSLLQEQSRLNSLMVEFDRQRITSQQEQLENQKSLDSASIALKAALRERDRVLRAFQLGAVNEVELDRARDNLETSEVLHKHAELDFALDIDRLEFEQQTRRLLVEQQELLVSEVERQVNELTLLSPVTGIVGNLLVNQKTNVARNQPVLSVVDLTAFEVEIQVPEAYVADLAIGMDAEVITGTIAHAATLVAVSPEIVSNQVSARLRFSTAAPDTLRQNQRLTTRILLEEKHDVVMVQRGQFIESGNGRIAYVVRDSIAYRTPIVMGATSLSHIEIVEGLTPGDTIVVSSTELFNSAQTVLINN